MLFAFNTQRQELMRRYKRAVENAGFLDPEEKREWEALGYTLDGDSLKEAEKRLISGDIEGLRIKDRLEKLKRKNG